MERCDTAQQLEESTGITNSVASSSTEQSQTGTFLNSFLFYIAPI